MRTVPFTLSHAAAALPFRRSRLNLFAVMVGTFAPDFEYFLRSVPSGHFGHTLPGVFAVDLPLSLTALWLFHKYMREPIVALLPVPVQRRIIPAPATIRFWSPLPLALMIVSILVGVGTHILWDSFTHAGFWPYRHWALLRQTLQLPALGPVHCYKLFQHFSTVAGSAVLLFWFLHWYRTTTPDQRQSVALFSSTTKRWFLASMTFVALAGALIRAVVEVGAPKSPRVAETFVIYVVVTTMTLLWLQLLAYGVVWTRRRRSRPQV